MLSSAVVGGLGDILIQKVQGRTSRVQFDYRRLFVFSLVAGLYIAPVIHIWFDWLDKLYLLVGLSNIQKSLVMMLLDQTFGAVIINMFFFIAFELVSRTFFKTKFSLLSSIKFVWVD